jgi:hypothetical protein
MAKPKIDIGKHAAKMSRECTYFYSLKLLRGWLWEFIRRSDLYQRRFDEFTALVDKISGSSPNEKTLAALIKRSNAIEERGVQRKIGEHDEWGAPEYCAVNIVNPRNGNKECWAVPNPDIRYCDFIKGNEPDIGKPVIAGMPLELIELLHSPQLVRGRDVTTKETFSLIAPSGDPDETVFFGISKRARDMDIKEIVVPYIKKMLDMSLEMSGKRSTVRVSRTWKYSIMIYDLMKDNPEISYDHAIKILIRAFHKDKFIRNRDERDFRRYHRDGRSLISGEYLEFLIT